MSDFECCNDTPFGIYRHCPARERDADTTRLRAALANTQQAYSTFQADILTYSEEAKNNLEDQAAEIKTLRAALADCRGSVTAIAIRDLQTALAEEREELREERKAYIARELYLTDQRAESERERDRLRSLDGDDTPFEAVHAQIREGVLRAAEEIRKHDDVKAAHQIMAAAAQRAAGRLNSELKELCAVRARADRAEADLAAAREVIADIAESNDHAKWCRPGHVLRDMARAFLERTATVVATPGAPEHEMAITPAMFLAGVNAFKNWSEDSEEIECLVASMFYSMIAASHSRE